MFIYNLKINGNKLFKLFFSFMLICLIILVVVVIFNIFSGAIKNNNNSAYLSKSDTCVISPNNYTNVLKAVHENIDNYVGTNISFTGYVYKVYDLKDNQFILARDMIVSSDFRSVVVGFLCECNQVSIDLKENSWIELTGEITKGDYHGDMPIIKVNKITKINKPNEEFVYPPSEDYILTNGVV